jgi:dipeptidase
MLRIALERAVTPSEAVQVIVDLLDQFGQGGNCVSEGVVYYHNSFIIANADDAWVLEVVDKQWAARQIKDVYSISNCYTLGSQFDMASPKLVELAVQKGFSKSARQFNFAKDYSDFLFTSFGKGSARCATTRDMIGGQKASVESVMATLRHHKDEHFDPQTASILDVDVCMHAGFGPIRISQSTASMVVYLDGETPIIFATGTSAPCTSIFKPMWVDAPFFDASTALSTVPTSQADSASLFWSHERLHRATLLNYPERIKAYACDRDELEKKFVQGALDLTKAPARERADFSAHCFLEASQAEADWLKRVEQIPAHKKILNTSAWNGFNKKAGLAA